MAYHVVRIISLVTYILYGFCCLVPRKSIDFTPFVWYVDKLAWSLFWTFTMFDKQSATIVTKHIPIYRLPFQFESELWSGKLHPVVKISSAVRACTNTKW